MVDWGKGGGGPRPPRLRDPNGSFVPVSAGQQPTGPPANGTWYLYEGHYYMWSNGSWYTDTGNQAWIPVWFTTSPFQHYNELFAASQSGRAWPVWGTANQTADDPIALATHIEQMRGVLVMGFLSANDKVSIPIRDHDLGPDGQVIYGDSLLDPALPPMVSLRVNTQSTSDIVNTPSSTAATWSDRNVGFRGVVASDDLQFSVALRLGREPQPHWILDVSHVDNASGATRTFACWLVGCGAPIDYSGADWEVGSAGTSGHYHIYLPFDLVLPGRQNFLEDGAWSAGARQKFMQRTAYWNETYVAANSSQIVYFTDTGATGGGDVFASQVPPCVFVFGDDVLDTDRGTTVANYRMTSWGVGFDVDGYLTPEETGPSGRSIQEPAADEYSALSVVGTYGASNEWGVSVQNLCNTNNINGNPRAPVSGSGDRHFVVLAFGIDAAPGTAAAGNRLWSKQVAATTMDTAVLRERALWVARLNVVGGFGVVWWTDNGSSSGSNIFDAATPVAVGMVVADAQRQETFTIDATRGPMLRPDVTGSSGQIMYGTSQSGGKWVTEVLMGGLASAGLLSQGDNASRQVYLYALGASA